MHKMEHVCLHADKKFKLLTASLSIRETAAVAKEFGAQRKMHGKIMKVTESEKATNRSEMKSADFPFSCRNIDRFIFCAMAYNPKIIAVKNSPLAQSRQKAQENGADPFSDCSDDWKLDSEAPKNLSDYLDQNGIGFSCGESRTGHAQEVGEIKREQALRQVIGAPGVADPEDPFLYENRTRTTLMQMAVDGNVKGLRALLPESNLLVRSQNGKTAFDWAMQGQNPECLAALIPVSEVNPQHWPTLLAQGIELENEALLIAINDRVKAGVASIVVENRSPLIRAVGRGRLDSAKILVSLGCSAAQADSNGRTPLMHAAHGAYPDLAEFLLPFSFVDTVAKDGRTALATVASKTGVAACSVARFLLSNGADPDIRNNEGKTALFFAIESGDPGMIGILASVSNFAAQNDQGKTVVDFALERKDWLAVETMSEHMSGAQAEDAVLRLARKFTPKMAARAEAHFIAQEANFKKKKGSELELASRKRSESVPGGSKKRGAARL